MEVNYAMRYDGNDKKSVYIECDTELANEIISKLLYPHMLDQLKLNNKDSLESASGALDAANRIMYGIKMIQKAINDVEDASYPAE